MRRRVLQWTAAVVAGGLLASATVVSAGGAAPVSAAPVRRASTIGCVRDAAADLRWVTWLYRAFLGREPSLAAAAPWLAKLTDGASYRDVATAIATSDEAQRRIVTASFVQLLHRSPSAAELARWAPWTRANGPSRLAAELLGSSEAWARAGGTTAGWVGQTYLDVLGRAANAGGLAYWTGRVDGGASLATVALSLWNAPAHVRTRVDLVYRAVLGRRADAGGITYWSPLAISRGDTALGISLAVTQSAWNKAQLTYGGRAGTIPPACPPPPPRWVPAPGTVVRNLGAVAHLGPRLAALTFDDGPSPVWTPQILAVLRRYKVPATFFVVGDQARRYPDLVRQERAEGHGVGAHSLTHPNLLTLGRDAQAREIVGSADLVDRIVGPATATCFRPPYGNYNATTVQIAKDRGLALPLWSRDGQDWKQPGVDVIVRGNLDTRYDGGRGLIILHDGGTHRSQTVAALPLLIEALQDRGYRFVRIC